MSDTEVMILDTQVRQYSVHLTPREIEIAVLITEGVDRAEIAKRMGISRKTVDTHRGHLIRKLGFPKSTSVEALIARWVIKNGLVAL